MRKAAIILFMLTTVLSVNAQLSGDGYYRLKNVKSGRYARLIDNRGSINIESTSADLGALQTVLYFENVESDPATVMYISKLSNGEYNIATQGADLYSMMKFGIKVQKLGNGNYVAYQEQKGLRKVLNDTPVYNANDIYGAVLSNDDNYKEWQILPVSSESDNYIGIKPDVVADGKYYCAYYSGFPFKMVSAGMRAFYVSHVDSDYGICVIEEIDGTVPASTPVIVECTSESATDNRIELVAPNEHIAPISGNMLSGAYFQNNSNKHRNRVDYNPESMRVIGADDSGKLCFLTDSELKAIAANSSYLVVDGAADRLEFMTQSEYDAFLIEAGVINREMEISSPVYSIGGQVLDVRSLPFEEFKRGIHIINGHKYMVR